MWMLYSNEWIQLFGEVRWIAEEFTLSKEKHLQGGWDFQLGCLAYRRETDSVSRVFSLLSSNQLPKGKLQSWMAWL